METALHEITNQRLFPDPLEMLFSLGHKLFFITLVPWLKSVYFGIFEKQKKPAINNLVARRIDGEFFLDRLSEGT